MANVRDLIKMSPEEVDAFLHERHTMSVATIGPDGRPHVVAMWYGFLDGKPAFWTFAKSQKVLNLQRNPKLSVMLESGTPYSELRGLVIEGTADIIAGDVDLAARVMMMASSRHPAEPPPGPPPERTLHAVSKRVVIRINPVNIYTWDHTKLGGRY